MGGPAFSTASEYLWRYTQLPLQPCTQWGLWAATVPGTRCLCYQKLIYNEYFSTNSTKHSLRNNPEVTASQLSGSGKMHIPGMLKTSSLLLHDWGASVSSWKETAPSYQRLIPAHPSETPGLWGERIILCTRVLQSRPFRTTTLQDPLKGRHSGVWCCRKYPLAHSQPICSRLQQS